MHRCCPVFDERDLQRHNQAASRIISQFQKMSRAVQSFESTLGICQPKALVEQILGSPMCQQAGTVVSYLNTQPVIVRFRLNLNDSLTRTGGNAVTNSILHNRLQNQIGNPGVKDLRRNVHSGYQSILKTDSFDLEITLKEFHFLLKGHFLRPGIFQGKPKKISQTSNHLSSGVGVSVEECGN